MLTLFSNAFRSVPAMRSNLSSGRPPAWRACLRSPFMSNVGPHIPLATSILYSDEDTHRMLACHSTRITGRLRKPAAHCHSKAASNCPGGSRGISRVFVHCRRCFTHCWHRKRSVREHLKFRVCPRQSANGRARYLRSSENSRSDQTTSDFATCITSMPAHECIPKHARQGARPGNAYCKWLPFLPRRSPMPVR